MNFTILKLGYLASMKQTRATPSTDKITETREARSRGYSNTIELISQYCLTISLTLSEQRSLPDIENTKMHCHANTSHSSLWVKI